MSHGDAPLRGSSAIAAAVAPRTVQPSASSALLGGVCITPRRSGDPPRCVGSPRRHLSRHGGSNSCQQPRVVLRPCTRWSAHPAIVSTGRDLQTPAHQSDGKRIAASLDHPILHRDALAKHAAASRKKSRSFVTRAHSRLEELGSHPAVDHSPETPTPTPGATHAANARSPSP